MTRDDHLNVSGLRSSAQDAALAVAAERHSTWLGAVSGYLARRERELESEVRDDTSTFEGDRIRERLDVLLAVGKVMCPDIEKFEAEDESVIAKPDGATRDDHQIQLAYLLTPLGWRDSVLPALEAARKQAFKDWREKKDPERNQALRAELAKAIGFLQAVESDAHKATAMRRVVPPLPTPGSSLRSAM